MIDPVTIAVVGIAGVGALLGLGGSSTTQPKTVIKAFKTHGDTYRFRFQQEKNGTWTVWALQSPRNRFNTDVTLCHLYKSGEVCIKKAPRSQPEAEKWTKVFMVHYSHYVRTGKSYPGKIKVDV